MIPSEKLIIETPEQISLEFHLAGIGSRFLALLVDLLIQIVLYIALVILALIALPISLRSWGNLDNWVLAGLVLAIFTISSGYFAFFEAIWKGQTPGKRVARIRVIKNNGRPINAFDAIMRNVLRTIDGQPGILHAVGFTAIFFSHHNRRLGDMVAGTVVVHESQSEQIAPVWLDDKIEVVPPKFDVSKLSVQELQLVETFLHRKLDLEYGVRQATAERIAFHIVQLMGIPQEAVGYNPGQWRPEQFLEQIALDLRNVGRYR